MTMENMLNEVKNLLEFLSVLKDEIKKRPNYKFYFIFKSNYGYHKKIITAPNGYPILVVVPKNTTEKHIKNMFKSELQGLYNQIDIYKLNKFSLYQAVAKILDIEVNN